MKSVSIILKNIKSILPYLLLIAIYFFFVNLEARKDKNKKQESDIKKILPSYKSSIDDKKLRIKIPVIPYNK